nr:YrzI family small protein [Bacillus sp. ISL-45]
MCPFCRRGGILAAFWGGNKKGGEPIMTLNILFFTITINKRQMSLEEIRHNEMVEKMVEDNKTRQTMLRLF